MSDKPSELNVHSEETCDKGRRHEHEGHKGEHLHDLVLIEVNDTEDCILEVLETLKTEVGVVDERRDILEEDVQARLIFLRVVRTLEDTGDNSLFIDDILTDEHCVFLNDIDINKEFLADILTHTHLSVVLVDFL